MGLARAVPARIAVVVLTERGGRAELADVGEREMRQGHSPVTLTHQKLEFEISKGRYVCPPRRGCPRACCGLRAPRLHLWTAPPLSMWNIRRRVGAGRPCSGAACSLVTSVDCVLGSSWTLRPVMAVLLRPGSGAWQSTPGDTRYGRLRARLNWANAVCGGIAR